MMETEDETMDKKIIRLRNEVDNLCMEYENKLDQERQKAERFREDIDMLIKSWAVAMRMSGYKDKEVLTKGLNDLRNKIQELYEEIYDGN